MVDFGKGFFIGYNTKMSDAGIPTFHELIVRAKAGDRSAFDALYRTYMTPVYRYVYIRLRSREDAEDIVQETFMRAYRTLDRYEANGETFLPYLFTIARNLLINHTKKKRPAPMMHEEIDRHAGSASASDVADSREQSEMIVRAMEALSETEKEVIELKFFGERTYVEIAAILGKREDAVRQRVARALKKLRGQLGRFE